MHITAKVVSSSATYQANVSTGESSQLVAIAPKPDGLGSSVNGGEFLMLALATCYCNDLYREAKRLGISIESAEVEASAEFPGIGLAATNISYRAQVQSSASADVVLRLMRETDAVAEVHNTIRAGVPVHFLEGSTVPPRSADVARA